jgi:prepilin-type N-terminal cleavage/methylation domain-containing protein
MHRPTRCAAVRGRRDAERGFTLLEAAVALAIVAMVVVSYLGIRTAAIADGIEARNWRLARELAEERISELLAGAHEFRPESGVENQFEKYPGFSYKIMIGETAISELESQLASAAAEEDQDAAARAEWQRNRDTYRKAAARGLNYLDYQDQLAQEEYQRKLEEQAPSETEFEDVAVVVFFPKLDPEYDGQKESFLIKAKASTLAISGFTPDQARLVAESKGQAAPGLPGDPSKE